jgi:hypothetical protein
MSEKSFSEEFEAILSASTFADLARAVEPFSRRLRQTNPSYARAEKAFEGLPKIVRKRFAKLSVFDSAALVLGMANRAYGLELQSARSVRGSASQSDGVKSSARGPS